MSAAPRKVLYERRDVAAWPVAWGMAGLFLAIGLSAAFVTGLFALFGQPPPVPSAARITPSPAPRLELKEGEDRAALDVAARAKLTGYAWIDRDARKVRIPIERAMELQAKQGWPP
jgi:hypothetical protein